MKELRLAASGIIIQQGNILLAKYQNKNGKVILVAPGGGVEIEEDLETALQREILEETGIQVSPAKILFIEDLLSNKYRMIKIWFLCFVTGGKLIETEDAKIEGIVSVDWYSKEQLKNQIVYPEIISNLNWNNLLKDTFQTKYISLKKVNF